MDVQVLPEWAGQQFLNGLVNAITRELDRFSMIDWAEYFLEFNDFIFLFFSFHR